MSIAPESQPLYQLHNGVLKCKGCIRIGNSTALHHKIVSAFHDSPMGGHSGFPVTYKRIHTLFRWVGMKNIIKEKVQSCLVCQQAKIKRVTYPGLLSPLPVPSRA